MFLRNVVFACKSTRRYNPEQQHRHLRRSENLKSNTNENTFIVIMTVNTTEIIINFILCKTMKQNTEVHYQHSLLFSYKIQLYLSRYFNMATTDDCNSCIVNSRNGWLFYTLSPGEGFYTPCNYLLYTHYYPLPYLGSYVEVTCTFVIDFSALLLGNNS
jgi:hypothetical protein